MLNIGYRCTIIATQLRGLIVGKLSVLGEIDLLAVHVVDGGVEWFKACDLELA